MTTTDSPAPLIEDLFCQGHPLAHVIEVGTEVGWSRADVMAVLAARQWDLDGSGRLPRSKRITVPQGLRSRPTSPAAPQRPAPSRLQEVTEQLVARGIVDGPAIDDWEPPATAPAARDVDVELAQPPVELYSTIADWADGEAEATEPAAPAATAPEVAPVPAEHLSEAPAPAPAPKPTAKAKRAPAIPAPDTDAAVARFLTERTVTAPDEQFVTSPELRDAYEAWRGEAGAPAATTRQFGSALTARYRKKQSPAVINGAKPMCYFGLTWKPLESPASVVAEVHAELVEAAPMTEPTHDAAPSASGVSTIDLLAVGRTHGNRRVRAAAAAVERAVDAFCAALSRAGRDDG